MLPNGVFENFARVKYGAYFAMHMSSAARETRSVMMMDGCMHLSDAHADRMWRENVIRYVGCHVKLDIRVCQPAPYTTLSADENADAHGAVTLLLWVTR